MRSFLKRFQITVLLSLTPLISSLHGLPPASAYTSLSTLAQNRESQASEGDRWLDQGFLFLESGQTDEIIPAWEKAIQAYADAEDWEGWRKATSNVASFVLIAGVIVSETDTAKSIPLYQQAILLFEDAGNLDGQARGLNYLASDYFQTGRYTEAIEVFNQALTLARQVSDPHQEAIALSGMGASYLLLHNLPAAVEHLQPAIALFNPTQNITIQLNAYNNLAMAYNRANQYQQALTVLQQLQQRLEAIERQSESRSFESITLFSSMGTDSIEIARKVDLTGVIISRLHNLGQAYVYTGQYPNAVTVLQEALSLSRLHRSIRDEANSLGNLGRLHYQLGQYPQAIESLQKSIALSRQTGQVQGLAIDLGTLGGAYLEVGETEQAITLLREALTIAQQNNDTYAQLSTLITLGGAYGTSDDYELAIEPLQQAVAISQSVNEPQSTAAALSNLGLAFLKLEQYSAALENFQQALQITQTLGNLPGQAKVLGDLGRTYMLLEQYPQATDSLYQSIDLLSSLRNTDLSDADRISLFETQVETYRLLEVALAAQGRMEAALEVTEQGRARAFVKLLMDRLASSSEASIPETPTLADIKRIAQQRNATLVQYSVIDLGDKESLLFIWVVAPSGEITFEIVDSRDSISSLTALVTGSRGANGVRGRTGDATVVVSREAQARQQEQLRQLHQLLIEPIAQYLPTDPNERVIFIPQGELFLVPFAALVDDDDQYLIEKHTILTAPSIQVLDFTRQQRQQQANRAALQGSDLLIVGNPVMPEIWNSASGKAEQLLSLPGSEVEAVAIAQLFNTKPLLGKQASEAAVREQISQARVIHLATHGLLDYGIPEQTGVRDLPGAIALAPSTERSTQSTSVIDSGLLTSAEILQLNLNAELLVLSACNTGVGRITGDGVIGLSRAAVTAGVPSIIVSLWAVDDAATAELMVEFYQQWQQTGDKAQALRRAMLATMQNHPDPRLWAAFTLIGEAE
ncbi:MAG TPA: CHAT domain-containing protein [Leptolyngbyaceae cyanobacterium]